MYCVNCGVKLADSEKSCPLCGVRVYHPDIFRTEGEPLFPPKSYPGPRPYSRAGQIILTTLVLMGVLITLICDLQINGGVTWSGYAVGAMLVCYVAMIFPFWFRKRESVIFVPMAFVAAGLYLLYINYATGGNWFLSFALPVTGCLGAVITGVVALLRFLRGGRLYIFGGATIALGLITILVEVLICTTFESVRLVGWSVYPAVALTLLGGMLIVLAVSDPAREMMERKFFI